MIRVVYRWRVATDKEAAFRAAWSDATQRIRETFPGARGSLLLRGSEEPADLLTIARWDKKADWQAFWRGETPAEMALMHQLAERISVEVYDEIEHHSQ